MKTLKLLADRLRYSLSKVFKILTIFYAVISIYDDFVGCGHAIQYLIGKAYQRTSSRVFNTRRLYRLSIENFLNY